MPEVTALVRQTILQQRFAESKEQDYVFREDTNDIRLRKECTWAPKCAAPFGVPGVKGVAFDVVHYSERHFEIFWLDGVRVARVLPSCDRCGSGSGPAEAYIENIPVSESEFAAENQRVDSEVGEAKALRAQGKDASFPDDPPQILLSRMLELCAFSNPRRQIVEDRPAILLDFAWNPAVKPASTAEALVKFFSGTIWIDEEDHAVQHVEGRFLDDVKLDGGNFNIRKGTRVTITNRRVDAGIWLLARLDARGEGRYFTFSIDGDGHIFTGSYRKLDTTNTAPHSPTEVPTTSPVISTPKPPQLPVAMTADAQSSTHGRGPAQETQTRGHWSDPSTGLMWAGKDNGEDVDWRQATNYCHGMRLAGYTDWRLATIDELQGIYDASAVAPGEFLRSSYHGTYESTFHVKGSLFLTGETWSGSPVNDDRGRAPENAWYFNFIGGERLYEQFGYIHGKRALCVRPAVATIAGTQSSMVGRPSAQATQVRGYWVDTSTGLLWAWKDNGKDINWRNATKYCRDLRLAGYSDWRLPTIDELQGIYDKSAESPGENPRSRWHEAEPMDFHVKGNLFLTGNQWSSPQIADDRGHPSGYAWRFDFDDGRPFGGDEVWFDTNKRALCVRRPGASPSP